MKINIYNYTNSIAIEDMTNEQFNVMLDAVYSLMVKEESEESEDDF